MQNPKRAISLGASALVVIAIIIIVASGVYLNDTFNIGTANTPTTSTSIGSSPISSSSTPSTIASSAASSNTNKGVNVTSNQKFELVFRQVSRCINLGFIAPWTVVLSNRESITANPPNGTSTICCGISQSNPSTIIFNVTSGTYTFSVTPNLLMPASGTVTVDDQNTTATLGQELASCGSTTTGTTTFTTTTTATSSTRTSPQGWSQGGVASLVLTSPEVLSYVEPAYTYDLYIVQDPFAANLANALVNITETQNVSGNWTGGYQVTYSGIMMLNATVQFTAPSSYKLISVGVTNLPNKTYSINYTSQQLHIIQVALSNSTVESLVSGFSSYYVNAVSGLVGNGTGIYRDLSWH
ncbi:MAG: hypothetical protein ACYC7D_14955 [Nitrososphaerales archaeon]